MIEFTPIIEPFYHFMTLGTKRIIDVLDVNSQKGTEMTMMQWVKYYNSVPRKKILNVISLEFSHSKLDELVTSPTIVSVTPIHTILFMVF